MEIEKLKQLVEAEIQACSAEAIEFRHSRHKKPDLTWQEEETAQAIEQELAKFSELEVLPRIGKYGVMARLRGDQPSSRHIGLRADMDALPIQEETGLSYASERPGKMHACGHDGHMAVLLGTVQVLHALKQHLAGTVTFIFQPAEEGGAGARVLCEEGALDGIEAIFGLHGWPELPLGQIGARKGPLMAGTAFFDIKIKAKGGHAAMPHLAVDSILVGSQIVSALQSIAARNLNPAEPAVVSVTQFHAGTTHNVLPDTADISGTIRTVSPQAQKLCTERLTAIATETAAAYGATVDVKVTIGYPPTINHGAPVDYLQKTVTGIFGEECYKDLAAPTMGSEDFSYYLQNKPGAFFFLGLNSEKQPVPSLHHPKFDFQDKALPVGIKTFSHLALGWHQS